METWAQARLYCFGSRKSVKSPSRKSGRKCTEGGGTTVLESHGWVYGPGGQGVYWDPVEGPLLYYHYVDIRIGYGDGQKRFGVNRIDWSSGWPVV